MIEHRTVVDQIEVRQNGQIRIRFDLQMVEGNTVLSEPVWHRITLNPGDNVDEALAALNTDLTGRLGRAPCPESELRNLRAVVSAIH